MNDFCFANYYKIMKFNSLNTSINDIKFMGDLFSVLNIEHFYEVPLQKATVSRIINRSLDVPSSIRELLLLEYTYDEIEKSMNNFINKYYNINACDILCNQLKELITKNKYLSIEEIANIINDINFLSFMTKVYLEAIRVPNKIVDVKNELFSNGKTLITYDF